MPTFSFHTANEHTRCTLYVSVTLMDCVHHSLDVTVMKLEQAIKSHKTPPQHRGCTLYHCSTPFLIPAAHAPLLLRAPSTFSSSFPPSIIVAVALARNLFHQLFVLYYKKLYYIWFHYSLIFFSTTLESESFPFSRCLQASLDEQMGRPEGKVRKESVSMI